jgi:RHS repeat-associated protein
MRERCLFARGVSFVLAGALIVNAAATGLSASLDVALGSLEQWGRAPSGAYTDAPRPAYRGETPSRDPKTRALWSEEALEDARYSSQGPLRATIAPLLQGPGQNHTTAVEPEPGSPLPWEGGGPSSNGMVNTGNGNKLTKLPLVSWPERGGMEVDFTLYHNSQTTYNDELGKGWTWTYDIYINQGLNTATVHWGDGLAIPFTGTGAGTYASPTGIHDTLIKNANGTWTLTKKDQTKYQFTTAGFCNAIQDRNGNQITLTLNAQNYVTQITGPSGRAIYVTLDSHNNFVSIEDPAGRVWTFNQNTAENLTTVTHPVLDSVTYTDSFTYDANSRILTHTDKRGKNWTFTYNGDGSLKTETNPLSHTWTYTYASSYTEIKNPLNGTVRHNYSSGQLASVVDEASFSKSYVRDSNRNVTSVTDKRGKVWSGTYDSKGNLLTLTNPLSKTWTFTYNSTNDLLTEKDPLNNTTTFGYDANGNLLTVTDPLNRASSTSTYDTHGQLLTSKDALNNTDSFGYNANGDITSATNPLSRTHTFAYDVLGRLISHTNPVNNTTAVAYDVWGRPVTVTNPGNTTVLASYNANHQRLTVTNERGKLTSFVYDDAGRLTSVTNAKNETETYAYNANGWQTSITNGRGKVRSFTYTARGEELTLTLPDNSVETWAYNGNGEISAYVNPLNQTINYVLDDAGRLTTVDYPTGTDTTFGYDVADRRTSMADATGTTTWAYNAASELTQLVQPQGTISYTYDAAGRRRTMVQAGVGTTTYHYDLASNLTRLDNPHGETTRFRYDAASRVDREYFHSGAYAGYAYDARSRLTTSNHLNSGGSFWLETYTYDGVGNMTSRASGGVTTTYTYDDVDQLVTESRTGYSASYTFDANGNRLTKTLNGVTEIYSYDDGDKLLSAGGKTYGYDAAGRTTSVTSGGQTTTLAYDFEGRLTQITYPNLSTNTFSYNGLDTRVSKVDSGGTRTYLRNGAYVTDPVLTDGAASYTPGMSERRSGVTTYNHSNLKSMERQTNSAQSVTASRTHDAYGMVVSSSGSWQGPFGHAGGFGYQGDTDSGLQLLGHRYYDPGTGRFLTRDPIQDGRNWYTYCGNNPLVSVDPEGLQAGALAAAGGFAVADGPLPFGDVIAAGILAWVLVESLRHEPMEARKRKGKEHTKNKRPSTKHKHEKGKSRKKRDRRGGEKGDVRRPYGIPVPGERDEARSKPGAPVYH